MSEDVDAAIRTVFRAEWGKVVAGLIRITGDWALAEDCVQDAFAAAARRWPLDGVPASPGAWLTTTARNRALDRLRRSAVEARKLEEVLAMQHDPEPAAEIEDDRLRLDLHLLPPGAPARGAGGPHPAHALRPHRRRDRPGLRRLRGGDGEAARAGAGEDRPRGHPVRRAGGGRPAGTSHRRARGALPALHRGLRAARGRRRRAAAAQRGGDPPHPARRGPAAEGARGARPARARAARRTPGVPARTGADGVPVPLDEQDRSRWDTGRIAEGTALLAALDPAADGPYTLQARIAFEHDRGPADALDRPGRDRGALRTPRPAHALAVRRAGAGRRGEPRRRPGCRPRPARAARARPAARLPARRDPRRPPPPGRARREARAAYDEALAEVRTPPSARSSSAAAPRSAERPAFSRRARAPSRSQPPALQQDISLQQDENGRFRPAEPISSC